MPRASRTRRRYTPEQRAARAEQDRQLNAEARADLADPQVIRRRIADLLAGRTPARLLTYSLRNQLLILRQAEQRGITLTDIDTRLGWNRRGRLIAAGQQGLRIARPVGAEDDDSGEATDPDTDQPDTDPDTNRSRPRFRMSPRWDISQTVPMDQVPDADAHSDEEAPCPGCDTSPGEPCRPGCTCPGCTGTPPAGENTPADLLWNSLQEQITNAGYRFHWPAPAATLAGATVRTDHDTRTVHVAMDADAADHDAVSALAVALGEIVTRTAQDSDRRAIEAQPSH